MKKQTDYILWYKRRRRFLSLVALLVAILVWVGWLTKTEWLTSAVVGFPPMSPLAAVAVALFAVVIFQPRQIPKGVLTAMAVGVGIGGLLLVILALIGPNQLPTEFKNIIDGPSSSGNNFAPLTPLCLTLLSVVILMQQAGRWPRLRQAITISIFFTLYFIFIGHITQADYVRSFSFFAHVSIPAEISLFLLSLALIYREGTEGLMGLLTSGTEGGAVARQLMIFVVLLPTVTTSLTLLGVRSGLYQTSVGTALNVATNVLFFEFFVWHLGQRLRRVEEEKNKAQEDVLQREQQLEVFQQATDASTEGVVMTNTRAEIFYVNAAWERLTGWKLREVLGKNPRILQSGKTDRGLYVKMWKALVAGKTFVSDEIINRRKNGHEYNAELHIYPVRQSKREVIYVGLEQDVSNRKAIDRAKTEFVSIASHQLATPLTSMRWSLELLVGTKPLQAEQRHYLEVISNTNLRMIALVNALLNTSRVDVGSFMIVPQPIDVGQEIRSVLDEVKVEIEQKQLRLMVQTTNTKKPYLADPTLLRIIVQNLVTNAIRYTNKKGKITVNYVLDSQRFTLSVSDTGFGIPPDEKNKIFEKMYRATNAVAAVPTGSGLGLYIVKAVVDRSGGTISYVSELGKGTTFVVSWPAKGWTARTGNRELSYHS